MTDDLINRNAVQKGKLKITYEIEYNSKSRRIVFVDLVGVIDINSQLYRFTAWRTNRSN